MLCIMILGLLLLILGKFGCVLRVLWCRRRKGKACLCVMKIIKTFKVGQL